VVPGRWIDEIGWSDAYESITLHPPPSHWISVEDLMRSVPFPTSVRQQSVLGRKEMAPLEGGDRARLTLRVRREIKECLSKAADANGRSTNAEAEVRLQYSFFEDSIFRVGI
jgi:hypothetical protein